MHPSRCPTREELSAYLLGKLPKGRLEAVADHVITCASCEETLKTLENVQDSLVPLLRLETISYPPPDPELQRLLGLAKSVGPRPQPGAAAATPVLDAPGHPAVGEATHLGQYRLLEKIGQGGMGAVYKAMHLRLEKVVALKVLPSEHVHGPAEVARFEREMRAVGKLNHPNIIRATDAGEVDGVPFLVMEFVAGSDLHKLVRQRGPLPVAEACELVRQAAVGLQHAHEHGLVHRDIKPSNLLLSDDGQVKVLDLGLARFHSETSASHELTALGQGMGTVDYMAPEQALDAHSVDIRADLYSLGCTLYHLLADQPPFGGPAYPTAGRKRKAHAQEPPPPLQSARPDVPDALASLVQRLLAKQPADRPATPREVAADLAPFALNCNLKLLLDQSTSPPEEPRERQDPTPTSSGLSRSATGSVERPFAPSRWLTLPRVVVLSAAVVLVAGALLATASWLLQPEDNQGQGDPQQVAGQPAPRTDRTQESGGGRDSAPITSKEEKTSEKPLPIPKEEPEGQLAAQGVQVLKTYCYRCHGIDFKVPRFNVLDRAGLVAHRGQEEQPYVVPGKPLDSQLWQRVGVDEDMPPRGKKPSAAEKDLLKKWIVAGAPFPGRPVRPFRSEKDLLLSMRDHLRKTAPADRPFQRYFSLTHLYNNHQQVSADELRLYRAALAKLVNSLSWKPTLVIPMALDADETVFAVDLRDLGWDSHDRWKEILKAYPYGLTHRRDPDEALRTLACEVYDLAGNGVPCLRADWFIATASRPPLYHTLLELPDHAGDLEKLLKVDARQDFLRNKLARAGLIASGVSKQNRLLDRHDAVYGAYWKSYDFKSDEGAGNLVNFPLGPFFADHPEPQHAFRHAGGEIIFNLPNGLQGYLLVDDHDRRIDVGPIEVVRDALETAGTPQIVNGLSCMACHKHGMIPFEDKIRGGTTVKGDGLVKVQELFRTKATMDGLLAKDEDRFLRALDEATGRFLKVGADKDKSIRDFPEPVGAIARLYVRNLGLEEAAYELGLEPAALKTLLANNRRLRALGLGPLAEGGTIQRSVWSSLENVTSLFHNVARELELGTPQVSF